MAREDMRLARWVKRPALGLRILRKSSIGCSSERLLRETYMMDRLTSKFRIWHFSFVCRHDPERIGIELRRMLVDLQEPARWTLVRELMLSQRVGALPGALGAVAASRWKITNSAEIARVYESLTEAQRDRIYAAVDFMFPWRGG